MLHKLASLQETCNGDLKMPPKKAPSTRWKNARKKWTPSGKPRKQRTQSTTPRKKRVTKVLPIPAKGDYISLADVRKKVSKKKLSDRLQILGIAEFKAYARRASISERHARRDRGPHPHDNRLTESQKQIALDVWASMTKRSGKREGCTQANLLMYLEGIGITVSRSALNRFLKERANGAK